MDDGGELITFALGNDCNEEKVDDVVVDDDEIGLAAAFIQLEAKEDHISPEDLAWVDSCFVSDPESAVESWADLKEALLDTISAFAAFRVENNGYGLDDAEAEQMQFDTEKTEEQPKIVNNGENTAGVGVTIGVSGEQTAGIQQEIEARGSIFRVWDLQAEEEEEEEEEDEFIPELKSAAADLGVAEEGIEGDGFITQPKMAVASSTQRDGQRLRDPEASIAWENLDELVSGLGDLSL